MSRSAVVCYKETGFKSIGQLHPVAAEQRLKRGVDFHEVAREAKVGLPEGVGEREADRGYVRDDISGNAANGKLGAGFGPYADLLLGR